jgi:hypothetical protein
MALLRPSALTALVLGLALAGCTPASPPATPSPTLQGYPGWPPLDNGGELVPIPVTSELAVGTNRFLLNLVTRENEPLASPDRKVSLSFYDVAADPVRPASTVEGTYLPTIEQLPGLYRAEVEFGRAGTWGLEVEATEPDGSQRSGRMLFSVRAESTTPAIGGDAPASSTPTADSLSEIEQISTDDDPDPTFYQTSVEEALAAERPFLLVFSTPAFCKTSTCGPALDIVKSVAPDYAGRVEFIHVEPYRLESVEGHLQPVLQDGQLVPVESVVEWGLLTEPMIFAVDDAGKVRAKFEGVASADEISAALEEIAD